MPLREKNRLHQYGAKLYRRNIPESVGNLENLNKLNLAHNNLSGTIPTALGNNLQGKIPMDGISEMLRLFILTVM